MVGRLCMILTVGLFVLLHSENAAAQQTGGIRGMVYDEDFNTPLAGADVIIAETGQRTTVTGEGNFLLDQVPPGIYTLVFSKEGYTRRVKGDVVVAAGRMTELDASLYGEFTEMEEYIVQEVEAGSKTEVALLALRMESPALMDSISADFMSAAGASDAASALNLVTGATVADGKYAVIRGLPDRYVNSQMNSVRLPTADTDKRAVELDLFPSSAIESIQVSKTFTPDQQGDASGGAVNVILKSIPEETILKFGGGGGYNQNVGRGNDFLTYKGGDLDYFGFDDGGRKLGRNEEGESWDGAVGVMRDKSPDDYKWDFLAGGKYQFSNALKLGGLVSAFYERDSSYYENGKDDKYWVTSPGEKMTPAYSQGSPSTGDFVTSLFDITKGSQEVKWGVLGGLGAETENNKISLSYLYTRVAESVATLAENTRGKEYYFPGYDPDDPTTPGHAEIGASPYLRLETLDYTERTAQTIQLRGEHTIPLPEPEFGSIFKILRPVFDWSVSKSTATLYQPDKRQFGAAWLPEINDPGIPPYVPPVTLPAQFVPFKPAANFLLGNLQRTWKEIEEESDQYALNLKLPFRQWSGDEGYLKFGYFNDEVTRFYDQESFSNFDDNSARYLGDWDDYWSEHFPNEEHPITAANIDVDYEGLQKISAWYYMADIPLTSFLRVIGGVRYENTELSIINTAEEDVTWYPEGATGQAVLNPGDADVFFEQEDVLPSLGVVITPLKSVTLRASYSETVARQTFKELTPIQQQEYLGGDVFVGNPSLMMSAVKNYDLRMDYTPFEGSLVSVSHFKKDITNPIEYVQRIFEYDFTTPVNYPEGRMSGYEFELRQDIGKLWDGLEGLTIGANATLIESEVTLPEDEAAQFEAENIKAPMKTRDMTNAPEHLYNLYFTYNLDKLRLKGTEVSLFYTVRGDTLVAGAGQANGNFVPSIYETEYGTLNFRLSQKIGENGRVSFQAKNLLDPDIETVYRSEYIGEDVTKTSYKKGREFSLGFSYSIPLRRKEDNGFGDPVEEPAEEAIGKPDEALNATDETPGGAEEPGDPNAAAGEEILPTEGDAILRGGEEIPPPPEDPGVIEELSNEDPDTN